MIENRDAIEVMLQHDAPTALHYCDPPYVHSTRSARVVRSGKGYRHEMTDGDHRRLAGVLRELQGMVVVSGYLSPLYEELYAGWNCRTRPSKADGGQDRTEVI